MIQSAVQNQSTKYSKFLFSLILHTWLQLRWEFIDTTPNSFIDIGLHLHPYISILHVVLLLIMNFL